MSKVVYRMSDVLSNVVRGVPVGTNLGLAYLMWMLMSGRLLHSRGAVIPGLAEMGMPATEVRRTWASLRYGQWEIDSLVEHWRAVVETEGKWEARAHDGWHAVAVDLTAFYRPRLQGLATKHYDARAGKELPAISFGLAARVGQVGDVRLAVPLVIEPMPTGETDETRLEARLLARTKTLLAADDVVVLDAGFGLKQLRAAKIDAFVLRAPGNFTARRNTLPEARDTGRPPEYGPIVRPLARTYKGKVVAATPADRQETFVEDDCIVRVQYWDNLVGRDEKVGAAQPFTCASITDPRFHRPLVLLVPVAVSGQALRHLYRDRWPVEVLPLTAKQIIGAQRQFVFADTSRHRLPELALLAGSILSYVAAIHTDPIPVGFWDRKPEATSGRLRRVLHQVSFSDLTGFRAEVRRKCSRTDHLPKGVLAHRRSKRPADAAPCHQAAA